MGALSIRNVRKSFGATDILKGIDIEVEAGEFLILRGPVGLRQDHAAQHDRRARHADRRQHPHRRPDVTYAPPSDRDIAMVFQSYALYPNMKRAQNIGFGLEMRNVPKPEREEAVKRVAKMLQIEHLLDRKPGAALRRPAAARRDGPRARAQSHAVPVRRAAVEPRREAARGDAHRDQAAAPARSAPPPST